MELHHGKHHQTYVNNLNKAFESYKASPLQDRFTVLSALNFNGGGHINHSLFWENLTPAGSPDSRADAAPKLVAEITKTWGGLDQFKAAFSASLLGITGSGWGWLVKDDTTGLHIVTTKDQDPVTKGVPIFGVDMWEHAYYLQVRLLQTIRASEVPYILLTSTSTSMARRLMLRISGTSSIGRPPRHVSRVAETRFSRVSKHSFELGAPVWSSGTCQPEAWCAPST